MKERIDLLHIISKPMSERFPGYKAMTELHEHRVSPVVKIAHALTVVSLAVNAACQKIGIVTPEIDDQSQPKTQEVFQPTDIPSTPEVITNPSGVKFLSETEVLQIPVARLTSGEYVLLDTFYEEIFKKDSGLLAQFEDPSTIKFSAMGIQVFDTVENRIVVYPFFSALSEKENKGLTAMVLVPEPGVVKAPILNRIVTGDGIVGLGITQNINIGEDLAEPILIFSTGLTETQVSQMSTEQLLASQLIFIPGGVNIQYERMFGKVNAITIQVSGESNSEVLSLPKNLGGDERYAAEIEKLGPDRVQVIENQVLVDWEGTGNFELSFEKVGENWEIVKFWASTPEGWDKVTVEDIIGKGPNGNAFLYRSQYKDWDVRAKTTGRVRIEKRRDLVTGEKLQGYMVIVEAVSRQEPGTSKFTFEYVAHADNGDGLDMMQGMGGQMKSVFDYAIIYTPDRHVTVTLPAKKITSAWEAYPWLESTIPNNLLFVDNPYADNYLLIPYGFGSW